MSQHFQKIDNRNKKWFYLSLIICLSSIFFTHPFLRLPFDPWEHLIKIRSIFDEGRCFLYWPENKATFWFWHWSWAKVFKWLHISSTFSWAYTIHFLQTLFALFSVFYFSLTFYSLYRKQDNWLKPASFAVLATFLWIVGNGTFSIDRQQAWLVWYSVTYQGFTLPLYWFSAALCLKLFFDGSRTRFQNYKLAGGSAVALLLIFLFHPSEAVYLLFFLIFLTIFSPKLSNRKKLFFLSFAALAVICAVVAGVIIGLPWIKRLIAGYNSGQILPKITEAGVFLVEQGGNRWQSSLSELAIISLVLGVCFWVSTTLYSKKQNTSILNCVFGFALFIVLLPTVKLFAGITGTLLPKEIVWRFFFACPWFLVLPLFLLTITKKLKFGVLLAYASIILVVGLTYWGSQKIFNQAFSGNVDSLAQLFNKERIGLQYDAATLSDFEKLIDSAASGVPKNKVMLYLRGDLATLARGISGYYAFSHRRIMIPMHKFYQKGLDKNYKLINVAVPQDFPKDRNIFKYFSLDEKRLSVKTEIALSSGPDVLFHVESADYGKGFLFISGWATLKGQEGQPEIYVILQSERETLYFDTSPKFKYNVGQYLGSEKLENTGFLAIIQAKELNSKLYRIGLVVRQNGFESHVFSKRRVSKSRIKRIAK